MVPDFVGFSDVPHQFTPDYLKGPTAPMFEGLFDGTIDPSLSMGGSHGVFSQPNLFLNPPYTHGDMMGSGVSAPPC